MGCQACMAKVTPVEVAGMGIERLYCLVPGTGPSPSIRCAYSGFMPCGYMDISAASQMTGGDLRVSGTQHCHVSWSRRGTNDGKSNDGFSSSDARPSDRRRIEDSFASCAGTSFLARTLMSAHVRQGESKVAHHHRIHSAHSHVHHSRIHAHTHPCGTWNVRRNAGCRDRTSPSWTRRRAGGFEWNAAGDAGDESDRCGRDEYEHESPDTPHSGVHSRSRKLWCIRSVTLPCMLQRRRHSQGVSSPS
jgi:hypothetical protein